MTETKQIIKQLRKKKQKKKAYTDSDFLSSGSTLLNLAASGRPDGLFLKGRYFFFVGDSTSGKTFLCLTCFAEAARNPHFDKYRLIYDNNEDGALMDMAHFFGSKAAARIEPPFIKNKQARHSTTVEEFYANLDDALIEAETNKRPFIYVLDSENGLSSDYEVEKFHEKKEATRKGKDAAGSYGDGKAKKHSECLRQVISKLQRTQSILIIIGQTRDSLGFGFEKSTYSGGRALKFYAAVQLWSSVKNKITKTVKGKKRQIGVLCEVKLKKNRITGKDRVAEIPIYHSIGVDDVGSCVDYLVSEKRWKKTKTGIIASDFDFEGKQEALIRHIEENGLENELKDLVWDVWNEIEDACTVRRKRRYD